VTLRPSATYGSAGNSNVEGLGSDGHIEENPPPLAEQIAPLAFVTFHVASEKS
jgi:hypothetical protein